MEKQNKPVSKEAQEFGVVMTWAIAILFIGTIFGVWIKVFWLGWVFA